MINDKIRVVILMSTYNGEKYLEEQLDSLYNQQGVEIELLVRDDGSSDRTLEILRSYSEKKLLKWYSGENLKPAKSFLDLISNAPRADYYAFCDQDDVWNSDKLLRAVKVLKNKNNLIPQIYASNYQLVDENLNLLPDNEHYTTSTYNAALAASCCTGCTMVFNRELLNILKLSKPRDLIMHDDWAHKVCLSVGGEVYFDKNKTLKYRQHGNNADGGIRTTKQKVKDVLRRIIIKDCTRSRQIKELKECYGEMMSEENYKLTEMICNYNDSLMSRYKLLIERKIITPNKNLNRGFQVAIWFGYF